MEHKPGTCATAGRLPTDRHTVRGAVFGDAVQCAGEKGLMGEGTGKTKIRRKDGDGKVRLGKHKADQEVQRFHVRNRWFFFVLSPGLIEA